MNNLDRIKNPDNVQGLNYFDVVIFHGKMEQHDDAAVQALKTFVERGKGCLIVDKSESLN